MASTYDHSEFRVTPRLTFTMSHWYLGSLLSAELNEMDPISDYGSLNHGHSQDRSLNALFANPKQIVHVM